MTDFSLLWDLPEPCVAPYLYINAFHNSSHNRYPNILPPDRTRVVLDTKGTSLTTNYINANYVNVGIETRPWIVSQAPISSDINAFWYMVFTSGVRSIFMLTALKEGDTIKAHRYWPLDGTIEFSQVGITIVPLKRFMLTSDVAVTELLLIRGSDTHRVTHYHYTGWPDFGVPSTYLAFEKMLVKARQTPETLVHCSAGCGRTGVFCSVYRALYTGESIGKAIETVRNDRQGLVQTAAQYRFAATIVTRGRTAMSYDPTPPGVSSRERYVGIPVTSRH